MRTDYIHVHPILRYIFCTSRFRSTASKVQKNDDTTKSTLLFSPYFIIKAWITITATHAPFKYDLFLKKLT